MTIKELSEFLDRLEKTSSRLEITDILSQLFKKANKEEIDKIVYLILGILAPSYTGIVFNLAERMMIRVIAKAVNISEENVQKLYKKEGDIGIVAQSLARKVESKLTVSEVYQKLYDIAVDKGQNSQERKIEALARLLSELDSLSVRFISRIPAGKLRLGFSDKTIIDALSIMEAGDKSLKLELEKAFNVRPDVGKLARDVKTNGAKKTFQLIKPDVEVPVAPMLAQRLNSPTEMIKKMGKVVVEPKFDGLRIFIHYRALDYPKKGKPEFIRIFTRNMNFIDNSVFPELSEISKYVNAKEIILDTEAVGMDAGRERLVDFQATMQRRRKHDIEKSAANTPLQFQVFDILLKDGKSLLGETYLARREELTKTVKNGNLLKTDEYYLTDDPQMIRELHEKYLKMGLEGIIVKKADSLYVSGRTGWRWVKMKEAEGKDGKLSDTIDAIVMGFTLGKGKRADFGIGQFLAGVRDSGGYKTITKVGTGLTDEQFRELKKRLTKIKTKDQPRQYNVHKDLTPDFWVEPSVVVELAADEITKSPKHTAEYALRFPRLIKLRDDKKATQATSLTELKGIFKLQKSSH